MIIFIYIYTPLDMGQTKYKIIQEIHTKQKEQLKLLWEYLADMGLMYMIPYS